MLTFLFLWLFFGATTVAFAHCVQDEPPAWPRKKDWFVPVLNFILWPFVWLFIICYHVSDTTSRGDIRDFWYNIWQHFIIAQYKVRTGFWICLWLALIAFVFTHASAIYARIFGGVWATLTIIHTYRNESLSRENNQLRTRAHIYAALLRHQYWFLKLHHTQLKILTPEQTELVDQVCEKKLKLLQDLEPCDKPSTS